MLAGILASGKEKEITQQGKTFVSILAISNNPDREQHQLVNLLYMRNANMYIYILSFQTKKKLDFVQLCVQMSPDLRRGTE